MKQKICALALTAALSISLLTTPAFAAETSFKDVSGHWAADAIASVVEKKLFNGTSEDTFSPDASMNRGMFVTVLGRFAESIGCEVSGTPAFSDVAADAYYAKYVAWGAANGIVNGVSETQFSPNSDVTREQMCALFVRFLEFVKYSVPETEELTFADNGKISSWAVDPVKTAVALGLIQGSETADGVVFNPSDSATRAQVATVFLRLDGLDGIRDLKPSAPVDPEPTTTPDNTTTTPSDQNQQPATEPGNVGGGGSVGGGTTVKPEDTKHTEKEIVEEIEIAGYLQEMLDNYRKMEYVKTTDKLVQDTYNTLMTAIESGLKAHNNGMFLDQAYINSQFPDEIKQVKDAYYHQMTSEQRKQFKSVGLGLGPHALTVLDYFKITT